VYYQNFATTVYLFRKDAKEFYHLDEQQVFDKALGLYRQAMQLAPDSFVLATDYAESYYGIKPLRTNDALASWTNAMHVAHTDAERQGVELHLARVKTAAGLFDEARAHLTAVTNSAYLDLKKRLTRSLADHEHPSTNTETSVETNLLPKLPPMLPPPVPAGTNSNELLTNLLVAPLPSREKAP
jgi:tetratricopeptide (TPR) repeat protein